MTRFNNPLDNIRIAAPCKADWEQMMGNDRARFCGQCNLNVYNLSGMTRSEAEHLIANNEGRLCVRFYRRADGSILTKNCPVGLRAIQRKLSYVSRAITSALLTFFAGIGIYEGAGAVGRALERHEVGRHTVGVMAKEPQFLSQEYVPNPEPAILGGAVMDDVEIGKLKRKRTPRRHR